MKIILSRKGSDSSLGKIASPILPDMTFCSVPIPETEPGKRPRLKDVFFNGKSLYHILEQVVGAPPNPKLGVHLDPDLDRAAMTRRRGWKPCFGQAAAAQTHLERQQVGVGDLFLFFGWFRKVEESAGGLVYSGDHMHSLFGWLQVGAIYHPGCGSEAPGWAADHPHVRGVGYDPVRHRTNTLYVAADRLRIPGLRRRIPGGGIFRTWAPVLRLTEVGRKRSNWRLPACFFPRRGASPLSYHKDLRRWRRDGKCVLLRTVGKGQEFVLDCDCYPGVDSWLRDIFAAAPALAD